MERAAIEALIDRITREVVALIRHEQTGSACLRSAGGSCSTCGLCVMLAPDAVQTVLQAGAERVSAGLGVRNVGEAVAQFIDHTLLKPTATEAQITQLCSEAREFRFASVCINPGWVPLAAKLLQGSPVKVCTVIGFPLGATLTEAKACESEAAIGYGATELDMVINIGALKSRDYNRVERDIAAVVGACHKGQRAICKVIIETGLLSEEEKVQACALSKAAGADYVKTSTGFGAGGATADDVALMRRVVGPGMGVKASGGVGNLADAQKMIAAGASRIGASAGVKIVKEAGPN